MKVIFTKLKGRIVERFKNVANFCDATGRNKAMFYNKLNGKTKFTAEDVFSLQKDLDIESEFLEEFFCPIVAKNRSGSD